MKQMILIFLVAAAIVFGNVGGVGGVGGSGVSAETISNAIKTPADLQMDFSSRDVVLLPTELPIYVPSGTAVITITSDDPLKTSYTVLYAECKKRGIPISLAMPSTVSSLSPTCTAGQESNWVWDRATDSQLAEMLTKGGACYVYHSNSHGEWQGQDSFGWFVNEATKGANYGDPLPGIVGVVTTYIDRESQTPGDRIAAVIQAAGNGIFETDGIGAEYITAQAFTPPGQWYQVGESDSIEMDNSYWRTLFQKYGRSIQMWGGREVQPIPNYSPYTNRNSIASTTSAEVIKSIDAAIDCGGVIHWYAHEWLDSGEAYDDADAGSAKSGKYPYNGGESPGNAGYSVTYTTLTTILDYIVTQREAGNLIALGVGGAMNAQTGTPINLLADSDMAGVNWRDTSSPIGWGEIKSNDGTATIVRRAADYYYTSDPAIVTINRKLLGDGDATEHLGWYAQTENFSGVESFLLSGKVRTWSGNAVPRVNIYAGETSDYPELTAYGSVVGNGAGSHGQVLVVDSSPAQSTNQRIVGGLWDNLLYTYDFDGTDAVDAQSTSIALNDSQSVVDEGGGVCSVLANSHGLVAGNLINFRKFINYPGVYEVHANTTANEIHFTATYAAETVDSYDSVSRAEWVEFVVPFNLPKPLTRMIIVLTTDPANNTDSEVHFADLQLNPAGPNVDK